MRSFDYLWKPLSYGFPLLTVLLLGATANAQLAINPSSVNFGNVATGSSVSQPVALNNTGSGNLTISQVTVSGTGFSSSRPAMPLTLGPGQSAIVTLTFAPPNGGSASGSFALAYSFSQAKIHGKGFFTSNGSATALLSGTGTAPGQLASNPGSLNFANVQVGGSLSLMDSLTNTGGASLTISQATVSGSGFSISGLNLPLVLSPGASVTFSAAFDPQSAASATGSITVNSNGADPTLTISLAGTGTAQGQLALTPTTANFGNVTVGSSSSQAGSLSAGGASVTVSSVGLDNGEFSLSGISLPLTIAVGQSVPFTLTFAPQTSGTASTVLSFSGNAANVPSENLSGTGVAPTQHSVALTWTDAGQRVVGFNVYRGGVSGGPYTKINAGLDATAAYSDGTVAAGQTYYYVATAVDGIGTESAYSNEVQSVIPTS